MFVSVCTLALSSSIIESVLRDIFKKLAALIQEENLGRIRSDNPEPLIKACEFKILGQFALIEANVSDIATRDVDAQTTGNDWVKARFSELLKAHKLVWDRHSHEIRMPKETKYNVLFTGESLRALIAQPEYVLISKALYAPEKNQGIFQEYIAAGPSQEFLKLAAKYKLDLEKLIG